MNIKEAITSRISVRGYLLKPVPQEIIKEILELSLKSPSAVNTQPWEFTVVTGEILNNIRKENIECFLKDTPVHDRTSPYTGIYRQRRVELAVDIFKLMDIQREDMENRLEWTKRGFRFFDAPAAIIISVDKSLEGSWALFDVGAIAQTICLAAMSYGLGTCIEDQGVMYPEVIRKYANIPDDKEIIIGIAIGYPDPEFPANKLRSRRESLDNITTWLGF